MRGYLTESEFEFRSILILLAATLFLSASRVQAEKEMWRVVTSARFVETLTPLVELRKQQGLKTEVHISGDVPAVVKKHAGDTDYLLIVGDDSAVPSPRRDLYRWRAVQPRQFAADPTWGDLDGDGKLDIPVGRLPAATIEEAKTIVDKILTYETREPALTDLAVNVWAGSPNYGPAIDSAATQMILTSVEQSGPSWLEPWIQTADPFHALCGWPPLQANRYIKRMQKGGLINVWMGHANSSSFYSMKFQDRAIGFGLGHVKLFLQKGGPSSPHFIFACDCAKRSKDEVSLAKALILAPAGPVASIASTTESHPLTNYHSGQALLKETRLGPKTLGKLWLAAQQKAAKSSNFLIDSLLKDVEGKLEAMINVQKLKRDQMLMYAILGDPATTLRIPKGLEVKTKTEGKLTHWSIEKPLGVKKLIVQFKSGSKPPSRRTEKVSDREAADKAFKSGNAYFEFKTKQTIAMEEWKGTVGDQKGTLRFVAIGKDSLHVATIAQE